MEDVREGTEIVFLNDVLEGPDEYGPTRILAKKNEKGKVMHKSEWFKNAWKVQPTDHNPFHCDESDFKIIDSKTLNKEV